MSKTILANNELVEITGMLKNQTWETIDLTPFLNHDDPKAVVIQIKNTSANSKVNAVRPVGSGISDTRTKAKLLGDMTRQVPVALNASNEVELFSIDASNTFYIHAEFGGDAFIANADAEQAFTGLGNQWVTRDITGILGANAGNAVGALLWIEWDNAGDWGYRNFGSTNNWHPNNIARNSTFGIVGVDSEDRYEFYPSKSGGKSPVFQSWFYEIGYFKRDWTAHVDPPIRSAPVLGAWTDDDLTGDTDPDAEIALLRLRNTYTSGPGFQGWARNDEGSAPTILFIPTTTLHVLVNLTDQQVYEYWKQNAVQQIGVMGHFVYTEPRAEVLRLSSYINPLLSLDSILWQ